MAGSKAGVASCIQVKQPKAFLIHCYGHALTLAVSDCIKQSKICRDALDVAFAIAKLIQFSPKRNAAFDRIRIENFMEDDTPPSSQGIRALCQTAGLFLGMLFRIYYITGALLVISVWNALTLIGSKC